ncbi:MAG: redox-regulated ATPase YchF [Thermodesulfovibrionales bacterium]|nr:redox-regulated ATPase YchF [Thermodesulfovibrionales bacterium]
MKIAVTGLSNSGKTTIFNALTGLNIEVTPYQNITGEPILGTVKVPDSRIDKLAEIFSPKKKTYATINYIDYLGLTKGDREQNRLVFDHIKDADAIINVIRAFEDDSVVHPLNKIDPIVDFETLELELIFGDLDFVDKRLQRISESEKKGKKTSPQEIDLLNKCKVLLESEKPLRTASFTDEERLLMRPWQFMSDKPEIVVINSAEQDLNSSKQDYIESVIEKIIKEKGIDKNIKVISLCGKIEMEISQLSREDSTIFLQDLGISEPARDRLIKISYDMLGLISFLTYGEDEVRAWTIHKGDKAQKSAGKIHSDIERGFIRAEVVSFDDFISCGGSIVKAKEHGLFRLEGKTYEVRDGDMINFRFNV